MTGKNNLRPMRPRAQAIQPLVKRCSKIGDDSLMGVSSTLTITRNRGRANKAMSCLRPWTHWTQRVKAYRSEVRDGSLSA